MARKLDAILYACFYVVIYFFANVIASSIIPLFDTLRRVVVGEIGWMAFVKQFYAALEMRSGNGFFEMISAMVIALFLIWLVFVIKGRRFWSVAKAKRLCIREIAAAILIAFGLQIVSILVTKIPFSTATFDAHSSNINQALQGNIWILLVFVGIIVPAFEEFLFRGIIYNELSCGGGFWFSNFCQSLLFAVLHFDIIQGIYAFFIGFVIGGVGKISKTIYPGIIIHIIFNVTNLLFGQYIITVAAIPYFWICGIVALILGYLLLIKKR